MVAGRRRWSATSDQARRWHTQWKPQQSREDAEEESEKMNVSPIPTACDPTQGEAVRYTGGSLRGETSRNVLDTHITSSVDRNGRNDSRNGRCDRNIGDVCNVGFDIVSINPNIVSAKYTWNRGLTIILLPVQRLWQGMYAGKKYWGNIYWYHVY